ncbi:MAG: hypothetical protein ACMG6H_13490, partial [Acidobacteriota bacterium]
RRPAPQGVCDSTARNEDEAGNSRSVLLSRTADPGRVGAADRNPVIACSHVLIISDRWATLGEWRLRSGVGDDPPQRVLAGKTGAMRLDCSRPRICRDINGGQTRRQRQDDNGAIGVFSRSAFGRDFYPNGNASSDDD